MFDQPGREGWAVGRQIGLDRPVFLGPERLDLHLPVEHGLGADGDGQAAVAQFLGGHHGEQGAVHPAAVGDQHRAQVAQMRPQGVEVGGGGGGHAGSSKSQVER